MSLTLAMGVAGATVLALGNGLVGGGKDVLVLYALVITGYTIITRLERMASFLARFSVGFGAFMISTLALYISIGMAPGSADLSFAGHAWRMAVVVVMGLAVSLVTARLAQAPAQLRTNL